jgi:hypothetical protein
MATNQYSTPGFAPRVSALFQYAEPKPPLRDNPAVRAWCTAMIAFGTIDAFGWAVSTLVSLVTG